MCLGEVKNADIWPEIQTLGVDVHPSWVFRKLPILLIVVRKLVWHLKQRKDLNRELE